MLEKNPTTSLQASDVAHKSRLGWWKHPASFWLWTIFLSVERLLRLVPKLNSENLLLAICHIFAPHAFVS